VFGIYLELKKIITSTTKICFFGMKFELAHISKIFIFTVFIKETPRKSIFHISSTYNILFHSAFHGRYSFCTDRGVMDRAIAFTMQTDCGETHNKDLHDLIK
jgi:hypothetical protein